jgi:hypothetical protein
MNDSSERFSQGDKNVTANCKIGDCPGLIAVTSINDSDQ